MTWTTEKDLYEKWLKKQAPSAHWQRIEAHTGTGVPDVNVCRNGHEIWCELKIGKHLKRKNLISFYFIFIISLTLFISANY
jgi:hypothetical protein